LSTAPNSSAPPDRPGAVELLLVVGLVWAFELAMGVGLVALYGPEPVLGPVALVVTSLLDGGWTTLTVGAVLFLRLGAVAVPLRMTASVPGRWTGLAVAGGLVGALVATVLHELYATGGSMMARLSETNSGLAAITIIAVLLPVVEEIYYRGLLFGALRTRLPGAFAVLFVAGWFAAVHASQVAGDWIALPVIAAMGLFWTVLRERTDSLWPGILSHMTYNVTLVVVAWIGRAIE
jgi:membrane protease YdiL (CAAX protease family)